MILKDIERYKKQQVKKFKDRYGVDIKFNELTNYGIFGISINTVVNSNEFSNEILNKEFWKVNIVEINDTINQEILKLKKENEELIQLLEKLELDRDESIK